MCNMTVSEPVFYTLLVWWVPVVLDPPCSDVIRLPHNLVETAVRNMMSCNISRITRLLYKIHRMAAFNSPLP